MAVKFCKQCGSEMAAGKRFCGRCGAAITEATGFGEPVGKSVMEVFPYAALDPNSPSPPGDVLVPLLLNEQPANAAIPIETRIEDAGHPAEWRPDEVEDQHITRTRNDEPAAIERDTPAPRDAPVIAPETKGRHSPRLLVGIGLVVVLIAVGAVGFFEWHKRSASVAEVGSAQPKSLADTRPTSPIPDPVEKLDNGKPSPIEMAHALTPEVKRGVAVSSTPRPEVRVKNTSADKEVDRYQAATPVVGERPTAAPIIRGAPATAMAGVLHYAGPPVHFGEVITFSGLPAAMLRFSFDHSSWQPRILHQSDGTQTLMLRSVIQKDQTQCEVGWEVAR
jgi:hypothetical protein